MQLDRLIGPGSCGRELRWRIGGVDALMCSDDPDLTLMVPPAVEPFLHGEPRADVTIHARWGNLDEPPSGRLLFDSGGLWKLYETGAHRTFRFQSDRFGPAPYKTARFTSDWSEGAVVLHRSYFDARAPVYALEYPLDELLCVRLLGARNGIELHACGVVDRGVGLVFVGQSGAGKSTTARLWRGEPGVTVLSDDRIIVQCAASEMMMHGTPWHGDEALIAPGPVPLAHVCLLRQDDEPRARSLRGAHAVARLFACTFPPFHSAEALADTLRVLEALVERTPCSELSFRPDKSVVDHVRSLL